LADGYVPDTGTFWRFTRSATREMDGNRSL